MRGATAAGETKRQASQQSPRRQTAMMACHFAVERCADAPIPALRLDASTPTAPFKCSLLDTSGTSSPSSSTTSPSDGSPSDGSLCLLHRCWIWLGGEAPWAPPRQREQSEGPRPIHARCRRSPAHRGTNAGCGEPCHLRDLRCLDPSGSSAWRRSERAVAGGGSAGSPRPREHRSGASVGGGRPRPPLPGRR
jgi:hypothetical protein